MKKIERIKIPKEEIRVKPRSGVIPSKPHKSKKSYARRAKHQKRLT